jgi:hypothetical protein
MADKMAHKMADKSAGRTAAEQKMRTGNRDPPISTRKWPLSSTRA